MLLLPAGFAQPIKVYLLCVKEVDSMWTEKSQVISSSKQLLDELNLDVNVKVVRGVGDWG